MLTNPSPGQQVGTVMGLSVCLALLLKWGVKIPKTSCQLDANKFVSWTVGGHRSGIVSVS